MTKVIDNTNLGYLKSKMDDTYWNKSDVVQIGIDAVPTANSGNLITSGAVEAALEDVAYVGDEQGTISYIDGQVIVDVSTKADKVSNATSGNFASLNSTGNIVDSGHKHSDYQATLVSGTNIKTINNESLLGSGNITISGGSGSGGISDVTLGGTSVVSNGTAVLPAYPTTLPASDVSAWAKASTKPTYTASEVGALPDSTSIPTESTVSGWGFTKNAGTVTGVKMNGTTNNPTSGVVDLGTVLTSETSLSKGTTSGSGNAVTDISVSGHQITLTKGSTFLTSETSLSKGTTTGSGNAVTDVSVSGHTITLTKGATFLTSYTETDPVFTASAAHGISSTDISNWNAKQKAITVSSSEPTSSQGSNGDIWIVIWAG